MKPSVADVARVYVSAARAGRKTTSVVAETFGVSPRTAGYWVRQARDAGLLDSAPTSGKLAGIPPKVLAVANALEVSPEALTDAIMTHAGGDLRITSRTIEW